MKNRWIVSENRKSIEWVVQANDHHVDDIEMAGFCCADIVTYGTNERGFVLYHHPVFPTLRLKPNNTLASYQMEVKQDVVPQLYTDGEPVVEKLVKVKIDGILNLFTQDKTGTLSIVHRCFPSTQKRLSFEQITVKNLGKQNVTLHCPNCFVEIDQTMGPMGINVLEVQSTLKQKTLAPQESCTYYLVFSGRVVHQEIDEFDADQEYQQRLDKVQQLTEALQLDTGNETLDTMFHFAKLRAGESVYNTKYGLMHSPGGKDYYAATWCNDQVEYAGPHFAYTGDDTLIEASMNGYRMYRPFMSNKYLPIPSSIIAEGTDYWNDVGDRGDAAMYLYGASRCALTVGDKALAKELLGGIEWSAEYCRRKINCMGVVASDTDELENRFPAGDANLCTSTLALDGYKYAAALERDFGRNEIANQYESIAKNLEIAIENHFGHNIHGFDTYRYYDGCQVLRSWICMPLCVGMSKRADATVDALLSPYLKRDEGFLTTEENNTIWDRSTLYALKGIFAVGKVDTAFDLLMHYCNTRLLGERVPYAVEAYPEGNKRHLSGESALFCKIITEGIINLRPESLHKFSVTPNLPCGLSHFKLSNIHAHGAIFNVEISSTCYKVTTADGKILAQANLGQKSIVTID